MGFRHLRTIGWMAAVLVVVLAGQALGDTVVTQNGRTLKGRVISREGGKVVFEVQMYGTKYEKTFSEDEVTVTVEGEEDAPAPNMADKAQDEDARPEAPPVREYDGATYYRVPLEGTVGKTFTARLLEASLEDALKRKPDVVILEIDSPGGVISEVKTMGEILQKYRNELRMVVFAKDALSAAAITSMAVENIYVKPLGRIGAATAWQAGEDGMPTAIAEKFQSVWRATARSMAEIGGHEPLLAEAMIDAKVALHLKEQDGETVVHQGEGDRAITKPGRLLTLTASEAVDVGLAEAKVSSLEELGTELGFESWQECEGLAVPLAKWQATRLAKAEEEFEKHFEEFKENLDSAIANDPARGDYVVYRGGRFTGASRKKWRRLAGICTNFLTKAEKNLEAAAELAEEYPGLLSDPEMIRDEQEKVSSLRKRVFAEMDRRGLGE